MSLRHCCSECRRPRGFNRDPLPVLLAAVRDRDGRRKPAGDAAATGGLPDQPGRIVFQGLDRGGTAGPHRPAADAAGPRDRRRPQQPATARDVRRGPGPDRRRHHPHTAAVRIRRGGGVRRRRPDQRKGIRTRQIRQSRAANVGHRLQRPVLHVVLGDCRQQGLRGGPRTAVPLVGHRRCGRDPAGRRESCGHHAAGHAVLRPGPSQRRPAHRRRPPSHVHRGRGQFAPGSAARHRPSVGERVAAHRDSGRSDRSGVHRHPYHRVRGGQGGRRVLLAGLGGTNHRDRRAGAAGHRAHPGVGAVGNDSHRPRSRTAQQRHRHRAGLHQPRAGARPAGQVGVRLRHHHRPGQRAGRSRARAEGRPAAGLPAA